MAVEGGRLYMGKVCIGYAFIISVEGLEEFSDHTFEILSIPDPITLRILQTFNPVLFPSYDGASMVIFCVAVAVIKIICTSLLEPMHI